MKKYNLPANHSLFLERTAADLTQEMFEDMLLRRDELREMVKKADSNNERAALLENITALNELFGDPPEVYDAVVDEWERQLEAGEVPDLES